MQLNGKLLCGADSVSTYDAIVTRCQDLLVGLEDAAYVVLSFSFDVQCIRSSATLTSLWYCVSRKMKEHYGDDVD